MAPRTSATHLWCVARTVAAHTTRALKQPRRTNLAMSPFVPEKKAISRAGMDLALALRKCGVFGAGTAASLIEQGGFRHKRPAGAGRLCQSCIRRATS